MNATRPRAGARLLTVQQVAAETGLPLGTLDKLISTGEIRVVEPPHVRRRFIDRRDLDEAIESWKTRGAA